MASFSIFQHIQAALSYPGNLLRLSVLSGYSRMKSWGKHPTVHFETPYYNQKILLIALFQKGELRSDVRALMTAARSKGIYVVAVNSLTLKNPDALREFCDCYVERYNFGRDFGSFKWGFCHLIKQGHLEKCPRLLMVNDSVFYSRQRIPTFLDEMLGSETEVLGATENYEISHHLGSFCIAMGGTVLRHRKFQRYWKNYLMTDVRPVVIVRGEMGLSKVLKRCVTSQDQFKALYDSNRFREFIRQLDSGQLENVIGMTRECDLTPAKRFSLVEQLNELAEAHSVSLTGENTVQFEASSITDVVQNRFMVSKYSDLIEVLNTRLIGDKDFDQSFLREHVIARMVDNFRQHSQIHQNACILLFMGLPIIKLDIVFRGMLNMMDVDKILDLLEPKEAADLQRIIYARPFGGDVLFGWKRSAFMRGLI